MWKEPSSALLKVLQFFFPILICLKSNVLDSVFFFWSFMVWSLVSPWAVGVQWLFFSFPLSYNLRFFFFFIFFNFTSSVFSFFVCRERERDGERENWGSENRERYEQASDLLQETQRALEEGLWALRALRCRGRSHSLLPKREALWVLKLKVTRNWYSLLFVCLCIYLLLVIFII